MLAWDQSTIIKPENVSTKEVWEETWGLEGSGEIEVEISDA